jgi:hypothetical protein
MKRSEAPPFSALHGISIPELLPLTQRLDVTAWRRAKQSAILAAELRRALAAHPKAGLRSVEGFPQHESSRLLELR